MVVDAGPDVLGLMDADAQAEDEAAAREELERRGLLGHDGGRPQGQLEDAGPQGGPGRVTAATASVVKASPIGWGQ